jgi:hypothetical protein
VLLVGEWAMPYHQLLRRAFTSGVNDVLIAKVLRLWGSGLGVRVAIDERRLHARADHVRIEERDYWAGPPFTAARIDDPTVPSPDIRWHGWPAGSNLMPWEIDEHLSVRTSLDGVIRTIEIEEVTSPSLERESAYRLVRYIHVHRDITQHTFVHVDGSVRYYNRSVYE